MPATSPAQSPHDDEQAVAVPPPRRRRSIRGQARHPDRRGRAGLRACPSPWPPARRSLRNRKGHAPSDRRRPSGARGGLRTRRSPATSDPRCPPWRPPVRYAPPPADRSVSPRVRHRAPRRGAPPDPARRAGFRRGPRTDVARLSRHPENRSGPGDIRPRAPRRGARALPTHDVRRGAGQCIGP